MNGAQELCCADPGNWEVPYYVAADFATDFVYQRAKIAQAANKPFILEETGKAVRPLPMPRNGIDEAHQRWGHIKMISILV